MREYIQLQNIVRRDQQTVLSPQATDIAMRNPLSANTVRRFTKASSDFVQPTPSMSREYAAKDSTIPLSADSLKDDELELGMARSFGPVTIRLSQCESEGPDASQTSSGFKRGFKEQRKSEGGGDEMPPYKIQVFEKERLAPSELASDTCLDRSDNPTECGSREEAGLKRVKDMLEDLLQPSGASSIKQPDTLHPSQALRPKGAGSRALARGLQNIDEMLRGYAFSPEERSSFVNKAIIELEMRALEQFIALTEGDGLEGQREASNQPRKAS